VIVVTGGSGYVGRHVVRLLGQRALAIDDLRNSRRPIHAPGRFIESDISSAAHKVNWDDVQGIVHCAGSISPRESVAEPALYWQNNVAAALAFFGQVPRRIPVVLSSSCAVYGNRLAAINEETVPRPISPYGQTKLACESLLRDLGFQATALRYFNVAGGEESHRDEIHLIPRAVRAALTGEIFTVFGDGSQIRDFVHVEDLVVAHLQALTKPPGVYNLGSGRGYSVKGVLETVEEVTGKRLETKNELPHPADPKILVADIAKARTTFGWTPARTLKQMVEDTVAHVKRAL
jgi:UDP-glucose 4-epimerase